MNNPVGWFEIYVDDMPRARRFYETMLGISLHRLDNTESEMWAFPMSDQGYGASGALIRMPGTVRCCISPAAIAPSKPHARPTQAGASKRRRKRWARTGSLRSSSIPKAISSACIRCSNVSLPDARVGKFGERRRQRWSNRSRVGRRHAKACANH